MNLTSNKKQPHSGLSVDVFQTGRVTDTFSKIIWVGLDPQFHDRVPEVPDPSMDDAIAVCAEDGKGYISGSNERSVLLAVYRFLKELGCDWVRPGPEGERIPKREIANYSINVHEKASYRHRGVCMEGAVSYENAADMVDFLPKIGMNAYFLEHFEPLVFFRRSTIRREAGFRIAGVVEATYLRDDVSAELIADGCHLPHSLLRLAYKQKGPDRLALVTDAMRAAGLEQAGEFDLGGVRCIVEDGVAKLLNRTAFAGSIATADRLVRTCQAAGIPLADCVKMITQTPARIMGLHKRGRIAVGYDADIVIFDSDIAIKKVFSQGEQVV